MTKWTDEETRTLKRMLREEMTNRDISDALGRTIHSVQSRAKVLREKGQARPSGVKVSIWTKDMQTKLADMWPRNIALADIAASLGCTELAATSKANKMGLKRTRGLPMAQRRENAIDAFIRAKRSAPHMHPMWSMDEADRRAAFIEKFEAGMAVIRAMAEVRANA